MVFPKFMTWFLFPSILSRNRVEKTLDISIPSLTPYPMVLHRLYGFEICKVYGRHFGAKEKGAALQSETLLKSVVPSSREVVPSSRDLWLVVCLSPHTFWISTVSQTIWFGIRACWGRRGGRTARSEWCQWGNRHRPQGSRHYKFETLEHRVWHLGNWGQRDLGWYFRLENGELTVGHVTNRSGLPNAL